MDVRLFIAPVIEDIEALKEFSESLDDRALEVERDVAKLKKSPTDRELVANLFRTVHHIKGDAALCKFELAVTIAQPIEILLARFRDGVLLFSDLLAELILLAVDRLELATNALLASQPLDNLKLLTISQGLELLATTSAQEIETMGADLIEEVTGFRPLAGHVSGRTPRSTIQRDESKETADDLQFFRSLAQQFENRSPLFKGRTMRILRLAQETNKANGSPVDLAQLEAAVYVHDIGMMLLPESIWLKVGRLTADDKLALRNHPGFSAGLLQRMPGWEGAAQIVAQHHEMADGGGYPAQLDASGICPGAKILAIVDAFEAVMLKHIHRGKNRSVLRAIAEINACDKQFAPEWIAPFNKVIRKTIES